MTYGNGLETNNNLDLRYFPQNIRVSNGLNTVLDFNFGVTS